MFGEEEGSVPNFVRTTIDAHGILDIGSNGAVDKTL